MEFEPIDEDLEEALLHMVSDADERGCVVVPDVTPEFNELKRLGFFAMTREYIDGSALVELTYGALRYSSKKEKWEKEKIKEAGRKAVGGIASKAVEIAINAGTKIAGM